MIYDIIADIQFFSPYKINADEPIAAFPIINGSLIPTFHTISSKTGIENEKEMHWEKITFWKNRETQNGIAYSFSIHFLVWPHNYIFFSIDTLYSRVTVLTLIFVDFLINSIVIIVFVVNRWKKKNATNHYFEWFHEIRMKFFFRRFIAKQCYTHFMGIRLHSICRFWLQVSSTTYGSSMIGRSPHASIQVIAVVRCTIFIFQMITTIGNLNNLFCVRMNAHQFPAFCFSIFVAFIFILIFFPLINR